MMRFNRAGRVVDTVAYRRFTREPQIKLSSAQGTLSMGNPFAHVPIFQLQPDKRSIAVVEMDGARGREVSIARISPSQSDTIRLSYPAVSISAAEKETFLPKQFRTKDVIASLRLPGSWTPVNQAVVATNGIVWLGARSAGNLIMWTMVSPEGRIVGHAKSPMTGRLHLVDGTTVWGTEYDQNDVVSVVRYRLQKM